ncbi:hypothetical protein AVEN_104324-1 [Araneus ventricosus]|uniref:Uncharacterized protein n=1 Tax=Araneus ventricosus TaxID=182803 RepID=A0A4Y2BXP7_ARAVE|nr:hypothetical protein AVEN_104324-1 [Araneus ventricosus]
MEVYSLVTITSHFEATQGYFGTDLLILNRNRITGAAPRLVHQLEGEWAMNSDLAFTRTSCTADLQWNWVSNLEASGPEAETLPLDHGGPLGS